MSKELKIGDQVQINAVDDITADLFPQLVGSHQTIVKFNEVGACFRFLEQSPEGSIYQRHDREFMAIAMEDGWEYEIVS